jgi:hypothetical protein
MSTHTKVFFGMGMALALPVMIFVAGLAFGQIEQLEYSTGQLLGYVSVTGTCALIAGMVSGAVDCFTRSVER